MKRIVFLLMILCSLPSLGARHEKRQLAAYRVESNIKIDGRLDEEAWERAGVATNFVTYSPTMGKPAAQKSEVRVVYDNEAIYVGAYLYDTSPDSILSELTQRDGWGGNSDSFKITLNPYNDGQNVFQFELTTSNVQSDSRKTSAYMPDRSWNAVWNSETAIVDDGWIVEIEIPYAAIRFPTDDVQTWGINFWRTVRRTRETSSWNLVDRHYSENDQDGELVGLKNIKPPLRLELYPYLSGYALKEEGSSGYAYTAGLDMKIGLNESYTLDMTLIPDFGQRKSDETVLNLTPYEVKYRENRQFFNEGTELFNKAGLFYSRRVGRQPEKYYDMYDELKEGETLLRNPEEAKLINATKISGRNSKNFGIGVFNAMTANTYAEVENEEGEIRQELTDPFTNFNLIVLDQIIGKNSYVNFTNTNVYTPTTRRMANVSGGSVKLMDKYNTYGFTAQGALSMINEPASDAQEYGHYMDFRAGKFGGKLQYSYQMELYSDTYDPNDIGYLRRNNTISNELNFSYNIVEPVWIFNNIRNSLELGLDYLYNPRVFTSFTSELNSRITFTNFYDVNLRLEGSPGWSYDYFEPRVEGRFYNRPAYYSYRLSGSSDYRKRLALMFGVGGNRNSYNEHGFFYSIGPRFRINDKFSFTHSFQNSLQKDDIGYATYLTEDSIVFGQRDVLRITNTFSGAYVFNNKSSLSVSLRHYWSTVDYKKYFLLNEEGMLDDYNYSGNNDVNFNTFNVDLVYSWNFAPGSFLYVIWKNNIYTSEEIQQDQFINYWDNIAGVLVGPQSNSFSVKISYYLDYKQVSKVFK